MQSKNKFLSAILLLALFYQSNNLKSADASSRVTDFAKAIVAGYLTKIAYELFKNNKISWFMLAQSTFSNISSIQRNKTEDQDKTEIKEKKLKKRNHDVTIRSVMLLILSQATSFFAALKIFRDWDGTTSILENENIFKLDLVKAIGRIIGMSLPFSIEAIKRTGSIFV